MNISNTHLSFEIYEFIKNIGKSRSKQDEDRIIVKEIEKLKVHFTDQNTTTKRMKENIISAIYCEMLGHDASSFHIHAINLVQQKSLSAKRLGYLACTLFLNHDDELMLLLINSIQKDLNSSNRLEVSSALSCLAALLNSDVIPAVFPIIKKLLSHNAPQIRKKACIVFYSIYQNSPEIILEEMPLIKKALCDPDPSVMAASLHVIHEIIKASSLDHKEIVSLLCSILKQVSSHRLPKDFNYHRVPAPWIQVKLLSMLGSLGASDKSSSRSIYESLQHLMKTLEMDNSANFPIIYECVKTITKIYPSSQLLSFAASSISRFISSSNNNLKYAGITGLTNIIQVDPVYAVQHQLAVVDCLQDPDETLKIKTLGLLHRMINYENVDVIVDKLIHHLSITSDTQLHADLASKITESAERFSPNPFWYIETLNKVLEIAGNYVKTESIYTIIHLLSKSSKISPDIIQLRKHFVEKYIHLASKSSNFSDSLLRVISWTLGEYGKEFSPHTHSPPHIQQILCKCAERHLENETTRGWIITALTKLALGSEVSDLSPTERIFNLFLKSRNTDLQQRCMMAISLLKWKKETYNADWIKSIIASHDSGFDSSVLDVFVKRSITNGAPKYNPYNFKKKSAPVKSSSNYTLDPKNQSLSLNYTPYAPPSTSSPATIELPTQAITGEIKEVEKPSLPIVPQRWGPSVIQDPIPQHVSRDSKTLSNVSQFTSEQSTVKFSLPQAKIVGAWGPKSHNTVENKFLTKSEYNNTITSLKTSISDKEKLASALFKGLSNSSFQGSSPLSPSSASIHNSIDTSKDSQSSYDLISGHNYQIKEENSPKLSSPGAALATSSEGSNQLNFSPSDPNIESNFLQLNSSSFDSSKLNNNLNDLFENFTQIQDNQSPTFSTTMEKNKSNDNLPILPLDLFSKEQPLKSLSSLILHPFEISTSKFGFLWNLLPLESKESLPIEKRLLQSYTVIFSTLKAKINLSFIEIIDNEAIAAAKSPDLHFTILVHFKVQSIPSIDILAKCDSQSLLNEFMNDIRSFTSELVN